MNIKDLVGTKVKVTLPFQEGEFVFAMKLLDDDCLFLLSSKNRGFILDADYNLKEIIE